MRYDLVGVGMCAGYWQFKKLITLSRAINKAKYRPPFMVGGQIATPSPAFILKVTGADFVVMGEAENTVVELAQAIDAGKTVENIKGLALWVDAGVRVNDRRKPVKNLASIPWPMWSSFNLDVYRLLQLPTSKPGDFCFPVLSGRGCPYKCSFCYRMENGYRARKVEDIQLEMCVLNERYGINHFILADELLMISPGRVFEFCEGIIETRFKWDCSGRLNSAVCKPNLLKLMKRAGCEYVNFGIEALDNGVLKSMNKRLTVAEIKAGIRATLDAGLTPGLNIMWGNPGDSRKTLTRAVKFLKQFDGCAELRTIRPVTPYPGCPLYDRAVEENKLAGPGDFYARHTNSDLAVVQWTGLDDDNFHQALKEANIELVTNYYFKKLAATCADAAAFYGGENEDFRGFRDV